MKKFLINLWGALDRFKDWLFSTLIKVLIVILIFVILHAITKMTEVSKNYDGQYKNLVTVYQDSGDGKLMNVYIAGDAVDENGNPKEKIVILPTYAFSSPAVQYKTLATNLSGKYQVIILEYFGYGFSFGIGSSHPRTIDNIAYEIVHSLEVAGVSGPYNFVANDVSNVYALYLQQSYPEKVSSLISIDAVYPNEIYDDYWATQIRDRKNNVTFTALLEVTGIERIISWLHPSTFYIDKMEALSNYFGEEELFVYKNRIGSQYLSLTMIREIFKLQSNMKATAEYKYPNNLYTYQIASSEQDYLFNVAKVNKLTTKDLADYQNELITNKNIQLTRELVGNEYALQYTNFIKLSNDIDLFLNYKNGLITLDQFNSAISAEDASDASQESIATNTSTQEEITSNNDSSTNSEIKQNLVVQTTTQNTKTQTSTKNTKTQTEDVEDAINSGL